MSPRVSNPSTGQRLSLVTRRIPGSAAHLGSGSAIICLTRQNTEVVARVVHRQLPDSTTKILTADKQGFKVMPALRPRHS